MYTLSSNCFLFARFPAASIASIVRQTLLLALAGRGGGGFASARNRRKFVVFFLNENFTAFIRETSVLNYTVVHKESKSDEFPEFRESSSGVFPRSV